MKISHDEWLAEVIRVSARHDEGLTAAEWSKQLGISEHTFQKWLTAAKDLGYRVVVGWRSGFRNDKRRKLTPVYQVLKPKR
jgi:transposase